MIRCEWLGTPRILEDGRSIHLQRRKALGILAYLSVRSLPASREELKTLFWPEADIQSAGSSLRTALSEIRSKLSDVLIDAGNDAVSVNRNSLETDVAEFRNTVGAFGRTTEPEANLMGTCEVAVKLWRGSFLQGLNLRGSYRFDDWMLLTTESIRRDIIGILEPLAEWHLQNGVPEAARRTTDIWLDVDPLNEAAHRLMIRADLVDCGRIEALRRYEVLQARLKKEFDLPPSPETERLAAEIREQNTSCISRPMISFRKTFDIAGNTMAPVGKAGGFQPDQVLSQSLRDEFSRRDRVRYLEIDKTEEDGVLQRNASRMGRLLGVPHFLDGRFADTNEESGSLAINLTDILDGRVLWNRSASVMIRDIPTLTEEIAEEVIHRLTDNNTAARPAPAELPLCRAWRMQGIYQRRSGVGQNLKESIRCMEEAVKADPNSLRAVADKALSYANAASWGHWAMPPDEAYGIAGDLALSVLNENPDEAKALLVLGTIEAEYSRKPESGLKNILRALEKEPGDPEILVEAAQTRQRLWLREEGLVTARQAFEQDPADFAIIITLAFGLVETGRYRESLEIMDHFDALYPGSSNGLVTRSIILSVMGKDYEALKNIQAMQSGYSDEIEPLFTDHYGYFLARAGRTAEAESVLAGLEKAFSKGDCGGLNVALVHLGLGRVDECTHLLEESVTSSPSELMSTTFNPIWDQLVFEPGFREVCRKMGIPSLPEAAPD